MTIQHTDVPSNLTHEPKQIIDAITSDAGKVITPSSASAGVGVLRNLTLDEIDSTSSGSLFTNWAYYRDNEYLETTERTISSGVRTKITIDALHPDTTEAGLNGGTSTWDSTNNIILPAADRDVMYARLSFQVSTVGTDAYVDVEADIGGAVGVIFSETRPILKGSSAKNKFVLSWPIYVDSVSLANGISFYITPSANIEFWDAAIMVQRTHKGS